MFATILKLRTTRAAFTSLFNDTYEASNLDGTGSFVTKNNTFLDTSYTVRNVSNCCLLATL